MFSKKQQSEKILSDDLPTYDEVALAEMGSASSSGSPITAATVSPQSEPLVSPHVPPAPITPGPIPPREDAVPKESRRQQRRQRRRRRPCCSLFWAIVVLGAIGFGGVAISNIIRCLYNTTYLNLLSSTGSVSSSIILKRASGTNGRITIRAATLSDNNFATTDVQTTGVYGVRWDITGGSSGGIGSGSTSALSWFQRYIQIPSQCARIRAEVELPSLTTARFYAANGDITVSDTIAGLGGIELTEAVFSTNNGNILIGGLKTAKLNALTTNGRVEAFGLAVQGATNGSFVSATTQNGELTVRNITGFEAVLASSTNGQVTANSINVDRVMLVTTNNRITADAVSVRYTFSAKSSNGEISVGDKTPLAFLPRPDASSNPNAKLRVDVATTNARAIVQASTLFQGKFEVYGQSTSVTSAVGDIILKTNSNTQKEGSKGALADSANASLDVTTTNNDAIVNFK
ncbi:hypothetical protein BJ742DRAFT_322788 [Cladochytrium replicatum]|nr:hypothetical protein BJ742DRAFT_322788 [Cladochytrium replicatum]